MAWGMTSPMSHVMDTRMSTSNNTSRVFETKIIGTYNYVCTVDCNVMEADTSQDECCEPDDFHAEDYELL